VWDGEDLVGVYAQESTARADATVLQRDAARAGTAGGAWTACRCRCSPSPSTPAGRRGGHRLDWPGSADTALVTRMLLLDLVPVLGIAYMTEVRSRARQGRRFGVKWRSPERTMTPSTRLIGWVTAVSVLALLATNDPISSGFFANLTVVLLVMLLVQAVGALLHNRTRARR